MEVGLINLCPLESEELIQEGLETWRGVLGGWFSSSKDEW